MSTTAHTGSGAAPGSWTRYGGPAPVMVGALALSVRDQVQAVAPLLGPMSIVLAMTNDLAALLALNEAISTQRREVRHWAWAVLVLAGDTAAGLNTWHAISAGLLPAVWAVVVGIGPVLLAMVLSHLVALVLQDTPSTQRSTSPATAPTAAGGAAPARPVIKSSRADQVQASTLTGPGSHPALAVVPAAPTSTSADRGNGADTRVTRVAAQLRAGMELTGATVAQQLGCSARTGRRLLRQAQDRTTPTAGDQAPKRGTR